MPDALSLLNPDDDFLASFTPREKAIGRLFYLSEGRNAWHSTWTNTYYPNRLSPDLEYCKAGAESMRTQGSVFRIDCVPTLILKGVDGYLGICPINEMGPESYRKLSTTVLRENGSLMLSGLPWPGRNWLLICKLELDRRFLATFQPFRIRSYSNGSGYRLGWRSITPPSYVEFLKFTSTLRLSIPKGG